MKKVTLCVSLLCLSFSLSTSALGYIGKSVRIMGFGEHLAGVIKDEDTDIYRNPAHLSFLKRLRVFGQYNLVGYTQLKIAEGLTNKETGLLGLVVPLAGRGNLALVGELKPCTSKTRPSQTSETDYPDGHAVSSYSGEKCTKSTIGNFKAIYSLELSGSLRAGVDFVYLKNYNRRDSDISSTATLWDSYFGDLIYHRYQRDVSSSDDSPDAQRGSLGLLLTSWPRTSADFTLYYENLSYSKAA